MNKYAVIGNPIQHSLSPFIHQEFAKQFNIRLEYIKIEAPLNQFEQLVKEFMEQGGKGMNITLPFKERAYQLADQKKTLAEQAKAANTFLFHDDLILADSTDGVGLVRDLTVNHQYAIENKKILVLGAGGAVRSILGPILALKPKLLTLANRTSTKAKDLAAAFVSIGNIEALGFEQLQQAYDLIINGTSAGLTGAELTLPTQIIKNDTWCYDLIYSKTDTTPFLKWAKKNKASVCLDGIGMLVEQAAAAFQWWHGVYPETKSVIQLLQSREL